MRSFVTCTYNSKYFTQFIESIKNIEYDELVIVDNGSNGKLVSYLKCLDLPKTVIKYNRSNTGEGAGVRKAMMLAKGDLIYKCDPDIEIPENYKEMEKYLKYENVGVVVSANINGGWRSKKHKDYTEGEIVHGCFFLLPRKTIDLCGYWEKEYFYGLSERDYALKLWEHGLKIAVAKEVTVKHKAQYSDIKNIKATYEARVAGTERFCKKWSKILSIDFNKDNFKEVWTKIWNMER